MCRLLRAAGHSIRDPADIVTSLAGRHMSNNADLYRLGILWPDGSTIWGEPSTYDDATVNGYRRHEKRLIVNRWEEQLRGLHVDPSNLPQPILALQPVTLEYGQTEFID